MVRSITNPDLIALMRASSPNLAHRVQCLLELDPAAVTGLLAISRVQALRVYSIRHGFLHSNGVDVSGLNGVLQHLDEGTSGETVWMFDVPGESYRYVGFVDESMSEVLGLVELPRNFEAEAERERWLQSGEPFRPGR